MSAYSLDLREKIVESGKRDVPKAETAHRFGIDRATVKRYCKQLDERGTLESRKAPGNKPKLEEQARRLLVDDLRQRPWATHSQRTDEMGTYTPLAPVYAYSPVREREDYERLCETSRTMIYAVMSRLLLRRLTRA
jgi:DNA-binding transcriptional MocR family regulator